MKINYSSTIEKYYLSEIMNGAVFFFDDGRYENLEGHYEKATGPYMLGSSQGNLIVIDLYDGTVLTNVNEDSRVYFPKKAELNIEK